MLAKKSDTYSRRSITELVAQKRSLEEGVADGESANSIGSPRHPVPPPLSAVNHNKVWIEYQILPKKVFCERGRRTPGMPQYNI